MQKILVNKIRCLKCGDVLESKHRHDFKSCSCKSISIDGGHDYLRRVGDLKSYEDLSETVEVEEDGLGGLNDYLRYRRICKDNNVASNRLSRKSGESD